MKNQKGFTLIEIVVAVGIMGIVTYAGVSAYQYFMGQSKKELKKLDNISEFTLFAKDVAKLAEGAGISTNYLNFPISKTCGDVVNEVATSPCLQTLDDREVFHPAVSTDLPSILNNPTKSCVQFYGDAFGNYERKKAFPGNNDREEDLISLEKFTFDHQKQIYATWPLVDENSKPFIVVKRRSDGLVLKLMGIPFSKDNPATNYTFFRAEGEVHPSQLEGYPFLIYGSLYLDQYMIHIAKRVVVCSENRTECENHAQKYNCLKLTGGSPVPGGCIPASPPVDINNLVMVEFKPLDEVKKNNFFQGLNLSGLPTNCTTGWDNLRQSNFYLFPTDTMSIQPPLDGGSIGWSEESIADFINAKGLQHFYGTLPGNNSIPEGLVTAVPIDIVSYFIRYNGDTMNPQRDLMARIYSEIQEVSPRTKLRKLKAPFYFARRLGTQELSIWYNPK